MPVEARFPPGWKYVIDPTRKSYKVNAGLAPPMKGAYGLKILAPAGHEYYSVERATTNNKSVLKEVSIDAFYEYIGAPRSKATSNTGLLTANNAKGASKPSLPTANTRDAPRSCGVCKNCTKEACGKCARCTASPCGTSPRCFQKVRPM